MSIHLEFFKKKNWNGFILSSQHYPERKLQANIPINKVAIFLFVFFTNYQKIKFSRLLKGSQTTIKWNLSLGCNYGSIYAIKESYSPH